MLQLARAAVQFPPVPSIVGFAKHNGSVHCYTGREASAEVSPRIWNHMPLQKTYTRH